MKYCCVPFCESSCENVLSKTNSNLQLITFHEFPSRKSLKEMWLISTGMKESLLPYGALVCSLHFKKNDFSVSNCGNVKLRKNSVPSVFRLKSDTVRFCIVCLDTDNKLYTLSNYLADAFTNVTGITDNVISNISSEPQLCMECHQRLINCNKFRSKSLLVNNLLLELVRKHGKLTLEYIKSLNRVDYHLTSNILQYKAKTDHFDLYLNDNEQDNNIKQENIYKSEIYSLSKTSELDNAVIGSEVQEESFDFDIDVNDESEYSCNLDDIKNVKKDSKFTNDRVENQVLVLSDDSCNSVDYFKAETDHGMHIYNDSDGYRNTLKNELVNKTSDNEIKVSMDSILKEDVLKTKSKVIQCTKKKVKKNKILFQHESEKKVIKHSTNLVKEKTQDSNQLKLFNVTVLSYNEQLADVQKRKETNNYKNSPFKCTSCCRGYMDSTTFERHIEKHTNKYGQYECAICGIHSKSRETLLIHLHNHATKYCCKICPLVSNHRQTAKAHEQWHNDKKFSCPYCYKKFAKRTSYFSHVRIKHPSNFVCSLCGYSFFSQKGLTQHKNLIHRFNDKDNLDGPTCEECNIHFASEIEYQLHIEVSPKHTSPNALKRNEPAFNRLPNKLYTKRKKPSNYTVNLAGSEKKKPAQYLCECCGKVFIAPAMLRQHMQVHTGEKLYKCHICDKSFMYKLSYTTHVGTHSDNQPLYECNVCGKKFVYYSNRLRHMRSHSTTRRYYKCEVCDKKFTSVLGRNNHVAHVHNNVPWPKRIRSIRSKPAKQTI